MEYQQVVFYHTHNYSGEFHICFDFEETDSSLADRLFKFKVRRGGEEERRRRGGGEVGLFIYLFRRRTTRNREIPTLMVVLE